MSKERSDFYLFGVDFSQNAEQRELIRQIQEDPKRKPVVFCIGNAGTGKTFAALAACLGEIRGHGSKKKKYKTLYYVREPVEVGHRLGYLKGREADKFAPYLGPLLDNYSHLMDFARGSGEIIKETPIKKKDFDDDYEMPLAYSKLPKDIVPLAPEFLRGRSFENCILLIDEVQNMTLDEIQMLCTRIGQYCKLVLLGSPNQIDIPGQNEENNDFITSYRILEPTGLVGFVELKEAMRSSFVADFDARFVEYKKNHRKKN